MIINQRDSRQMWSQMSKPVMQSIELYEQQIRQANPAKKVKLNVKRLSYFFTVDVIGKIVFSMDVNCFQNQQNPFLRNIFKLNQFSFISILITLAPKFVIRWLNLKPFRMESINYFAQLTQTLIEERNHLEIKYQDFLQLLIDSKVEGDLDSQAKRLTLEEIVGQAMFFFLVSYMY